jgi:hypothetical protein
MGRPLSAGARQQAITALAAMIHEWWMEGRDRGTEAVRGSGSRAALRQTADAEVG